MGERPDEIVTPRTDDTTYVRDNPAPTGDPVETNREQIEQNRAEMSGTIDEIQGRLSPQHLKAQAQDRVREATIGKAKGGGSSMMETIKQNPIPAAMAAVGLGWLFMETRKQSQHNDYYQDYYQYQPEYYGSSSGSTAQGRMHETAGNVQGKAQQTMGQAQGQMSHMSDQAQERAHQAKGGFEQMMQDNPLAVGVVVAGLGAAVGLAIPETSKENQVMGQTRDSLMSKAQEKAQDTKEKAQQVAQQAQSSAKEEAQNQGMTS